MKVPDILTSGNHRLVDEWRMKESLKRTYLRRPDLFEGAELTKEQVRLLEEIKKEHNSY
ncbi:tRNA (guanine-N(1)-)-methyltransferase [Mycobacteroides abscessus subsp. abscessus]|nr:tRNA (guanine-N(1)-)-methyltransferase [Mycobacteroides abscessus subsp. abscessus]